MGDTPVNPYIFIVTVTRTDGTTGTQMADEIITAEQWLVEEIKSPTNMSVELWRVPGDDNADPVLIGRWLRH